MRHHSRPGAAVALALVFLAFLGGCEHPAGSGARLSPLPADSLAASAALTAIGDRMSDPARAAALRAEVPGLLARARALGGTGTNGMAGVVAAARALAAEPRDSAVAGRSRP